MNSKLSSQEVYFKRVGDCALHLKGRKTVGESTEPKTKRSKYGF